MNILIMGLPGSGKTTLAANLMKLLVSENLPVKWFNDDMVREAFNDGDFSDQGSMKLFLRMRELSRVAAHQNFIVISDLVAPTNINQLSYLPDMLIWMDTVKTSKIKNINEIFEPPRLYTFRVRKKNAKLWAQIIFDNIMGKVNDTVKINRDI